MIFNFWRPYPLFNPKKEGWYQCTVKHGYGENKPRVMDLYFRFKPDIGPVWVDRRREQVFLGYKVYKSSRAPIEDNRVFEDKDCERNDIVAWKHMPKCYKWR